MECIRCKRKVTVLIDNLCTICYNSDHIIDSLGWICPKCGRYRGNLDTECFYCNNNMVFTTSGNTDINQEIENE